MAGLLFTNNASAALASSIITSSTTITVTTGSGALFPAISGGNYFYATLTDSSNNLEIVKVTARATDVLTVVRAQEGTTARAYAAADKIELRVTAAGMNSLPQLGLDNTFTGVNTFSTPIAVTSGGTGGTTSTGSGAVVLATSPTIASPTFTAPVLGTPASGVMTNVTGTATGLTAGTLVSGAAFANAVITTPDFVGATTESATITATVPPSPTNYDASTQTVQYYTTNATGNFTLNIRGTSSVSLNTLMATGQAMTLALLINCGATAYYPNVVQIDGTTVTPKWQNAITPSAGIASSVNIYVFTIIKTASATYTVLGSQTQFA
jgi:hypothetical protein